MDTKESLLKTLTTLKPELRAERGVAYKIVWGMAVIFSNPSLAQEACYARRRSCTKPR